MSKYPKMCIKEGYHELFIVITQKKSLYTSSRGTAYKEAQRRDYLENFMLLSMLGTDT